MDTIKSSEEITHIFNKGKRYGNRFASILVMKREHGLRGRVAFIAGKKWGNAVWRNRAKRRMRAICHELGGPWDGYDVVFLANAATTEKDYSELLELYRRSIRKATQPGQASGLEGKD